MTGEMCIYIKWRGICNVTHSRRSCLTAYFIVPTLFIVQGLKNPGKCWVCGSMETRYSELNVYTVNTILQTISLQMISNMKMPYFHLFIHFSFFRIKLLSRTIRICYLHPKENCVGLHTLFLVILIAANEIKKISLNDGTYPVLYHRGTQTFPTYNESRDSRWLLLMLAASGWRTAHLHPLGSWVWWRMCEVPHKMMSVCSLTSGHRIQR